MKVIKIIEDIIGKYFHDLGVQKDIYDRKMYMSTINTFIRHCTGDVAYSR